MKTLGSCRSLMRDSILKSSQTYEDFPFAASLHWRGQRPHTENLMLFYKLRCERNSTSWGPLQMTLTLTVLPSCLISGALGHRSSDITAKLFATPDCMVPLGLASLLSESQAGGAGSPTVQVTAVACDHPH